jgi:hypothetical protein
LGDWGAPLNKLRFLELRPRTRENRRSMLEIKEVFSEVVTSQRNKAFSELRPHKIRQDSHKTLDCSDKRRKVEHLGSLLDKLRHQHKKVLLKGKTRLQCWVVQVIKPSPNHLYQRAYLVNLPSSLGSLKANFSGLAHNHQGSDRHPNNKLSYSSNKCNLGLNSSQYWKLRRWPNPCPV